MKKVALLGLVVITTAGCGYGWLPFRPFRGAVCRGNAPCVGTSAPMDCNGCGTTTGYPNYDSTITEGDVIEDTGYYGGEIIHDGAIDGTFQGRGINNTPPLMQPIQPAPAN